MQKIGRLGAEFGVSAVRSCFNSGALCENSAVQRCATIVHRHVATIIDGHRIATELRHELKTEISHFISDGYRAPHLSVVLVGDDAASAVYVKNKLKACKHIGISSESIVRPASISERQLLDIVTSLNNNPAVDGILVQLPVPRHMNERVICNSICPHKDVDGFHVSNVGRFVQDMRAMVPCTPLGVLHLIRASGVETFGKNAVVCGRSKNVGMPIAMLLHSDGRGETGGLDMSTTICHRFTPRHQLKQHLQTADVIVTAAGVPNLISGDMVKPGACVIDVGINRVTGADGKQKIVGDVAFDEVSRVAGYITPVPGGVGPMTVAMLMANTVTAYKTAVLASATTSNVTSQVQQ